MGRWENLRQKLTVKSENSTWFVSPVWTERNYCVSSNFPAGQKYKKSVQLTSCITVTLSQGVFASVKKYKSIFKG